MILSSLVSWILLKGDYTNLKGKGKQRAVKRTGGSSLMNEILQCSSRGWGVRGGVELNK